MYLQPNNISQLINKRHHRLDHVSEYHDRTQLPAHKSLINRLAYHSQLEGHTGCVNCLQWNSDGSLLASGSDDYNIRIWSPGKGKSLACMPTGHIGNIFSVKFVPFTGDHLVLSGAEDKDVRLHDLTNFETVQVWPCASGRVKRLAVSPHSPFLCWSASEDGCVRQYDTRERHTCNPDRRCHNVLIDLNKTCGSTLGYTQCKCIDINGVRPEQLAVGSFDPYIRLYDLRLLSLSYPSNTLSSTADPSCLAHFGPGYVTRDKPRRTSPSMSPPSIATTYVSFSPCGSQLLANLSAEQIYLYNTVTLDTICQYDIDDSSRGPYLSSPLYPLPHHSMMSCDHSGDVINLKENDMSLSTRVLRNNGNEYYQQKQYTQAIHLYSSAIMECPHWYVLYSNRATALLSRNWSGDIYEALRDTERALSLCPSHHKSLKRRIKCLKLLRWTKEARSFLEQYQLQYTEDEDFIKVMDAALLVEQGRNGYHSNTHTQELSDWEANRQATAYDYRQRYIGHCNAHTDIKEATFFGESGEYIGAGSDDGNIFIWEKTSGNLIRILHGDDSIVNCIQWHPTTSLLATSGIENVIRLWEPKYHDKEGEERIVNDIVTTCFRNQARRRVDPFEMMLMSLRMVEQDREMPNEFVMPDNPQGCRQS